MLSPQEQRWLLSAYDAATKSGHIYPAISVCEAGLFRFENCVDGGSKT
jgi:hypothetical protein